MFELSSNRDTVKNSKIDEEWGQGKRRTKQKKEREQNNVKIKCIIDKKNERNKANNYAAS